MESLLSMCELWYFRFYQDKQSIFTRSLLVEIVFMYIKMKGGGRETNIYWAPTLKGHEPIRNNLFVKLICEMKS